MRKLALTILVFLMIGIFPVISWAGELEEAQTFDQLRNAIEKSISAEEELTPQSEKGSGVLEDAQERVRQHPNDAQAYLDLGILYNDLSREKEAIAAFKESLRVNPDNIDAYYFLGDIYHYQARYQEAIDSYRKAISIDPNQYYLHNQLGHSYVALRQYKDAVASYEKSIQIDPNNAEAASALERLFASNVVPFCESNVILPIDCTKADKNSREIWFEFTSTRQTSASQSGCHHLIKEQGEPVKVKVMRNGRIFITFNVIKKASEFLGLKVNPENSFVAVSGINGLKFGEVLNFELTQNIVSIIIKYAATEKKIQRCRLYFAETLRPELRARQAYELAHAEAVKSARKFGNVASPVLEQRTRETVPPSISFSSIDPTKILRTDAYQTFIRGKVTDNEGVLTLLVNGQKAAMKADGTFAAKLKLRIGENRIAVSAEDINGNVAEKSLTIIREDYIPEETLADVDIPPKTKTKNPDGIAIVIGVESYQYVSDATYAYNDAEVFREYLADTMGFSKAKVKIITNRQASLAEFNKLLSPNGWLARNVNPGKSEIVIYFSGHGIPDLKTKQTGLLPFDVDPNYSIGFRLSELYASLGNLNAKSVSVFLDACFTGENRERRMLLADARGIVVVPSEKSLPNNLTVLSAASGGQFSGALKEKEHGLFTYYVLKGLGGDADDNQDKKLTIGELGEYVQVKVKEQAAIEGREQIPELQGDTEKVLVQW
jgi:cytochrome c-type biogenesis protein CcmH/NrfG